MDVTLTDIRKITPYARNPRKNKAAISKVAASIKEFGFRQPIVVDGDMTIVVGHTRYYAAIELGMQEVPVHIAHGLTPSQVKAYRIMDNRSHDDSDWDDQLLTLEISDLEAAGFDLGLTGFTEEEIRGLMISPEDGKTDPDSIPITTDDPITKPGDLIVLGKHRLLCGDATKAKDVAQLMGGVRPDVLLLDPPYGMTLDTDYSKMPKTTRGFSPIVGDDRPFDASVIRQLFSDVKDQYWFGADYYSASLGDTMHSGAWLVWDKRVEEKYDSGFGSAFELVWSSKKRQRRILRHQWFQNHAENPQEAGARVHPTQKPTVLLSELMDMAGKGGNVVADYFLGSGSTLIAAEMTGRVCYGLEIDPKYCDVIVKRWEGFTGKKAERPTG